MPPSILLILLVIVVFVIASRVASSLRPRVRQERSHPRSDTLWYTKHKLVKLEPAGWTQEGMRSPTRDRRAELGLPRLENIDELMAFLGVRDYRELVGLCDANAVSRLGGESARGDFGAEVRRLSNYHVRSIPKRGGGTRTLHAPKKRLKEVQRRILRGILDKVPVHPAATAFTRGRTVQHHAGAHCARELVCTWDIRAFFDSVAYRRVRNFYIWLGYGPKPARILALLCTTSIPWAERQRNRGRCLPQGAPTSPALANAVCWRMDKRLAGLARRFGAQYTRYADDLAFSGDEQFKRGMARFIPRVRTILSESGFTANEEKLHIHRAGQRQLVTGLVVNSSPAPPRHEFDRLKAILTNARREGGLESQNRDRHERFEDHLRGRIAWIAHHRPARGAKLLGLLAAVPGTRRKPDSTPSAPPLES